MCTCVLYVFVRVFSFLVVVFFIIIYFLFSPIYPLFLSALFALSFFNWGGNFCVFMLALFLYVCLFVVFLISPGFVYCVVDMFGA